MTNDTIRNVTGAATARVVLLRDATAAELERVSGGSGGVAGGVISGGPSVIIGAWPMQQGAQELHDLNAPPGCPGGAGGGVHGIYAGLCS